MRVPTRRGLSIIYLIVVLGILIAFCSLAVDLAHARLAKVELQAAADAASYAGAAALKGGVTAAQDAAIAIAGANRCDATAVVLDRDADIEFGAYNLSSGTFTPLTGLARSNADAVRITTQRTAARGNPIRLLFASFLGLGSPNLTAKATATAAKSTSGYIGMNLTRMFDTTRFDGYDSSAGPYSLSTARHASVMSNNDLWLHDTCYVLGEAHWSATGTLIRDKGAIVNPGPVTPISGSMTMTPVTLGNVATVNNNSNITQYLSGTKFIMPDGKPPFTVPGGTYYFTQFEVGKNDTLLFNSPTTIYLNGDGKFEGKVAHTSYRPFYLQIKGYGSSHMALATGAMVYACIYDPDGDVHHHDGQSFGSVISHLLCFRKTGQGHSDEQLLNSSRVMLVK